MASTGPRPRRAAIGARTPRACPMPRARAWRRYCPRRAATAPCARGRTCSVARPGSSARSASLAGPATCGSWTEPCPRDAACTMQAMDGHAQDRLTVVVACFNEAASLPLLHPRLRRVLDALEGVRTQVLYVDDGSRDSTWERLRQIAAADPDVALLRLSRNFGKEVALTAGLDQVHEGAAMILDADGQDPPELIPEFVTRWREGYDDVYGTRV